MVYINCTYIVVILTIFQTAVQYEQEYSNEALKAGREFMKKSLKTGTAPNIFSR